MILSMYILYKAYQVVESKPSIMSSDDTRITDDCIYIALHSLFALYGLDASLTLCDDVCTGLGVDSVADLAECDEEILKTLPAHVKTQLTPQWRENFVKMCECRAPPADLSRS